MRAPILHQLRYWAALLPMVACAQAAMAQGPVPPRLPQQRPPLSSLIADQNAATIVAIVNGDVISRGDVDNRRRLFALSTGLPVSNEVLDRLTNQVTRQLIDERLRLQEAQRRHIVVQDREIAQAISEVEGRNGMAPGTLAKQLSANGVEMRTLIDQFRVQIAWGRVLRQQVAEKGEPSEADIAEEIAQIKAQEGQQEYHLGEIFTPVPSPAQDDEARRFIDTVIQQLRAGAPFPVVAAQFSQSQTALTGGDLGWVLGNELDPAVLKVAKEMPVGAVSNPIKVPGGYSVVTLKAKREVGKDLTTVLKIRQAWLPFTEHLNPQQPTAQQLAQLAIAKRISSTVTSCDGMEEANKAAGNVHPTDPGEIRLETIASPLMQNLLAGLTPGKPSPPLPAEDGISVIILCSRDQKNLGIPDRAQILDKIFNDRLELASRQLMRDLQRRAVIDQRA
jgi:peptidyl-prolyl cis-trans isomerase SurA